ncbi:MAG: Hsp20/alpha crystallin family protein [Elusimicrobiota bacterium]|nr:Hsp20/alpha crystallin family protein [Elusimicrobiota bacterium]
MAKKKKDLNKGKTAVPVRRKAEPFKKVTDLGVAGVIDSVKDEFFNRFPEVVRLAAEPRINICETSKKFLLYAAVAGMDREDVDIQADKDSVRISGDCRREEDIKEGSWLKKERKTGKFSRTFALPASIEPEKAKARCEKGELIIELPKKVFPERKKINIK